MRSLSKQIWYWLFSLLLLVAADPDIAEYYTYTSPVLAYDFKSMSQSYSLDFMGYLSGSSGSEGVSLGYFKAPATGMYSFSCDGDDWFWIAYNYKCCDLSESSLDNAMRIYGVFGLKIYLVEGFYYPILEAVITDDDPIIEFSIDGGSFKVADDYLYGPVSPASSDYNVNTFSGTYLLATTTSGTISTTSIGQTTTQHYGATTVATLDVLYDVVPYPVVTSYDTSSTVYTTQTTVSGVVASVIVDVIPYSTVTSYSLQPTTVVTETTISGAITTVVVDFIAYPTSSSQFFSQSSTLSNQGSVTLTTDLSYLPIQTYIWTGHYTSTIVLTVTDGQISVPSGGLFKRDVAYETAVLIPTPTSINWSNPAISTTVVEYLELYSNGQTSIIDVTYTRPVSSASASSFALSTTSTTTVTTQSTVTSTQTSISTVTKYSTSSNVVSSESGSIATTITTTATNGATATSSYTEVVTTTNSLGETIVYTEIVVVCPESTTTSFSSTSIGVVTTVNNVGETIVATETVVYCPESTRSTIGSFSSTSSAVITSIDSTATLVYTEVVVYCPESTISTTGSVTSTSTGIATTTNAEGATITYTQIVVYCPESGLTSQATITNSGSPTISSLESSVSKETSEILAAEQSSSYPTGSVTVEYKGGANNLETLSFASVCALLFMLIV